MFKPETNMNATVNIICYKQKTLKNGEHPLMIRVCKNRKVKYKSLGISVFNIKILNHSFVIACFDAFVVPPTNFRQPDLENLFC